MIALVPVLAFLAAAGAGGPWTRDYGKAFSEAEKQGRPVLLFFRSDCQSSSQPYNPLAGGPASHQEVLSECDLMQHDVWEDASVLEAIGRFIPVVIDGGDRTLQSRYQAVRMPTTLVTDPWGNEIVRGTGYIARDKMLRLLAVMPDEYGSLAEVAKALRANPADFAALTGAAAFYETKRLPQVVERLYGLALNTPRTSVPVEAWRKAVIARGLNLLIGLNQPGAAAVLFEAEVAASPEAAGTDALWLGVVNARLQEGKRKEAEAAVKRLEQKYPASPYAQRARQNLEATAKQ